MKLRALGLAEGILSFHPALLRLSFLLLFFPTVCVNEQHTIPQLYSQTSAITTPSFLKIRNQSYHIKYLSKQT